MFRRTTFAAVFVAALGSLPLQGAEPVPEFSAQDPSCACVAQGRRWAQGEVACISGVSMTCGMNQNVTTWKSLGTSCQVSSLSRAELPFTPM
jgi:hypothetical protein